MLAAAAPVAANAGKPVVVELFTSQGCSSCPPADDYLRSLAAAGDDVLPLAFHVTYWNQLGWSDPYALEAGTQRQRLYASLLGQRQVYTPQMVIDGRWQAVGSDRAAVGRLIRDAAAKTEAVAIEARREGADVGIRIGAAPAAGRGLILLVGYDPEHRTAVGRGENGGRTLTEANIVRSLDIVGEWRGDSLELRAPLGEGARFAILLQAGDGRIIGAARAD
ncbi:DUF1223 domain-containing protein [Zavarzinia aquatilis]|uniref:DUF1223 domain-containing protein n=2 Tax=Zavarzinia aquatilis TaxID=2211142 RepID=A0A317DY06_9PROT|nr:DUF1223 domain-containing protein [Zavarzinia aquatilis]